MLTGYVLPVPTPRPNNDRPGDLPGNHYAQNMKEYADVSDWIAVLKELIIVNIPLYIMKFLEDPELGIALVTKLQTVEASCLSLGTVKKHKQELLPMETPYKVHATNFTEMTYFLANNGVAISTVDKIKLLLDATNVDSVWLWAGWLLDCFFLSGSKKVLFDCYNFDFLTINQTQ